MNGAESALRTLAAAGARICFANPGTTEMPFVRALDTVGEIRSVLGLFEGVCTGAADGYARVAGHPALTLLHLGPGFANGIANLHNARRARTPLVNLIGDHASWHLPFDAPLTSDVESLARSVSGWVHTARSAKDLAGDAARAWVAACTPPGGVASLIVPADCQWEEADGTAPRLSPPAAPAVDPDRVAGVATALRGARSAALLLGGPALYAQGLRAAARIRSASGCRLLCETFPARLDRGPALPAIERLPYFPEAARESLAELSELVLVGVAEPVSFFGYPGGSSRLAPEGCVRHTLARIEEDAVVALDALADALDAPPRPQLEAAAPLPARPTGALTPVEIGAALAALQPEAAIVVDEAATSGLPYFLAAAGAPPHTVLCLTGGAIGMGLPLATGAALAAPERPVIALQADGSAMYTLQALWTQARESLDVTTVLCANRSYRILQLELARAGVAQPGPSARALTELREPELDWVALARGQGVAAVRVERAEDLVRELEHALRDPGPHLIETRL
jgi:acetolactate synthase-1/2/3 large subunit